MTPTVPVTVTYELTDLGYSLQDVMRGIKEWAEARMDEVLANRAEHDTPSLLVENRKAQVDGIN